MQTPFLYVTRWLFWFSLLVGFGTISSMALAQQTAKSDLGRYYYQKGQNPGIFKINVPVRPGDNSFLATAISADPNATVFLTEIKAPDSSVPYKLDKLRNRARLRSSILGFALAEKRELSVFYPMHPAKPLIPGTYELTFTSNSRAHFSGGSVLIKRGIAPRQAIDFNIWVAHTDRTLRSKAFQSRFGVAIRNQMNTLLNPHAMQVGQLQFYNASQAQARTFMKLDVDKLPVACNSMARSVGQKRAINLILVDRIVHRYMVTFGGISAGQPGSVMVPESELSCVIASYSVYGDDLEQHAVNFLHESAHFMGLPHTTEANGREFDRFSDTPECAANRFDGRYNMRYRVRGLRDGEVDDYECDYAGGANNFLFYGGLPEYAPFWISAQQAWTLKHHPLFYPVR